MPGIFQGERAELAGGEFVVGFRRATPGPDELGRDGEQLGQLNGIAALENHVHHFVIAGELSFSRYHNFTFCS